MSAPPGGGKVDAPTAKSRTAAGVKRTVHIVVEPPSQPGATILVQMDFGSGFQTIMDAPEPANPPPTFKFGFAASTGGANNIHEINSTVINTILPVPRLAIAKADTGPFRAGGTGTFTLTPSVQAGSDVGPEVEPVTVTDTLPEGTLNGTPMGTGWDFSTPQESSAADTFHVLPVGQDDFGRTSIGVPVGVPILDNDHGSLQPSSVIITSQPAHGTAAWNLDTQQAIYTPDPGWSGIDTFTYRVFDADGQPVNQTVTITVTPQAQDDSGVTPVNTPITVDSPANDLGDVSPATVAVVRPPGHGTATVNPTTGRITYTPAPGFTGQDTLVYSVHDHSGQPTSATVTIDVSAPPSPPPSPPEEPHAVGRADLVITKTVSPKVAGVGDGLTYTVTVTNRGPNTAEHVVGTDTTSVKAAIMSLKPSRGSCTIKPTLECSVDQLAPGAMVTVVARVRVLAPGELRDTASVTAIGPDPDPSTDSAGATVRILAAPLTITKRASPSHVRSGSLVSFRIRVTNRSGEAVRRVSVCDRLPAELTHVSGGTLHGTEVCWKIGSLAAGRSRTFLLRTRAIASHTRTVTNLATVDAPGVASRSARASVAIVRLVPPFTG